MILVWFGSEIRLMTRGKNEADFRTTTLGATLNLRIANDYG
jgi:hypothetical protein